MTDKFKKIDRRYVLSDSTVNEYGFRLLTTGYEMESFRKNPIGYYMHKREEGIVLKWEDLQVEDDKITAVPVINLSNIRGEQTCNEAENGFLNAASVGHIVVLEYSTDKELMLPGQTGPTITRWYNKECSLVDIPGNCNALTRLYDANENELNLADMNTNRTVLQLLPADTVRELKQCLQLADNKTEADVVSAVKEMTAKANELNLQHHALQAANATLQQQLDEIMQERENTEVTTLLNRALEDKKITVELKTRLAADYARNAAGLNNLLQAMPAYRSIAEQLKGKQPDATEAMWEWEDYEKNDPTGNKLKALRANDAARYKELFEQKFNG
jgi:hypothetical protein